MYLKQQELCYQAVVWLLSKRCSINTVSTQAQPPLHDAPMRLDDLSDVIAIEQRSYHFPWTLGIFRDCIKVGYHCRVLRLNQQLIGYGVMQVAVDEAHILNLCIDKPHNKRGYARELLSLLLDTAVRGGAVKAYLEARPSVPHAIRLYERAGFERVGVRKDYYESVDGREDALVMVKNLESGSV